MTDEVLYIVLGSRAGRMIPVTGVLGRRLRRAIERI
jgi:hypothetical protein